MEVKFLQFSDFHLDSKYLGLLDIDKIRQRKKELAGTFKRIIQFANSVRQTEGLDFILIPGDLFEQESFCPQTIKMLIIYGLGALEPLPVFITAGNHDPLQEDSPYLLYEWPPNVHIFKDEFEKIEVKPGVFIYGISATPTNFKEDVLGDFRLEDPDALNIVMFHGAEVEGKEIEEWGICFPFRGRRLVDIGADYFALGHYHNCRSVPRDGDTLGYYSGSPEPLSFKETGERFILKVKLKKGKSPEVEKISFQRRIYKDIEVDCTGISSLEELKQLIREYQDKDGIVNLILKGEVDPDFRVDPEELQEFIRLEEVFYAVNIKNKLRTAYNEEDLRASPLARSFLKVLEGVSPRYEPRLMEMVRKLGLDAIFSKEVRNWNEV